MKLLVKILSGLEVTKQRRNSTFAVINTKKKETKHKRESTEKANLYATIVFKNLH